MRADAQRPMRLGHSGFARRSCRGHLPGGSSSGEAQVEKAEELMQSKQIRRAPVVDAGKLVGMITLGDLARAAQARKAVTAGDVNAAFAAVVEPRRVSAAAVA